jgi:predicted glycoside hydrolase/deacetylase ChbG (UPF0249 family)
MKQKLLIVNADDFGMSKSVTDGILMAHNGGIVTSTSLMVNMPDTERAAELVRSTPSLDVGIHLNISEGRPILSPEKIPTIVNGSGEFLPNTEIIPRLKRFRVNPLHVEAEFSAQLEKMLSLGIIPSHLDTHHHTHIYPLSAWAFRRVADRFKVKKARATRIYVVAPPVGRGLSAKLTYYRKLLPITTKNIYKIVMHKTLWHNIACPKYAIGTPYRFYEPSVSSVMNNWTMLFSRVPEGISEADCHPGYKSSNGDAGEPYADFRVYELAVLTNPSAKEALRKHGVELISYRDLTG